MKINGISYIILGGLLAINCSLSSSFATQQLENEKEQHLRQLKTTTQRILNNLQQEREAEGALIGDPRVAPNYDVTYIKKLLEKVGKLDEANKRHLAKIRRINDTMKTVKNNYETEVNKIYELYDKNTGK